MIPIYVVDAFTDEPFRGNPAGVVTLGAEDALSDEQMQSLAAEMKHAETAFLTPRGSDWGLRWFTPATEVDLCGHATLASAFVLWKTGLAPETERITFHTRSGPLLASKSERSIELDFPAEPAITAPPTPRLELLRIIRTRASKQCFSTYSPELSGQQSSMI